MNEYDKQAKKFLVDSKTKCTIKEIEGGYPDWDVSHFRRQYNCTFTRNGKRRSFKFWASLAEGTCREYDILSCITKYDPEHYENFCANFGYDTDSRRGYKIYKGVVKEWQKVQLLWSDCLEQLAEIN